MTQQAPHRGFAFADRTCMLVPFYVGARHASTLRIHGISGVGARHASPLRITQKVTDMNEGMDRRSFIGSLGVTATIGASAYIAAPRAAGAVAKPKGKIPTTPFKVGHMTFQSGPGAALGAPALKGHTLAADEINAEGGFLGARKIVTITADEAGGVDGKGKEILRMQVSEGHA